MSYHNAVIIIDHHKALIARFDAESFATQKVASHHHDTPQHGSGVRDVHEFFAEVSEKLMGLSKILVTGPHTGQSEFRHYVEKHRPEMAKRIIGYETVDHPSDSQLVATARSFFDKYERLAH